MNNKMLQLGISTCPNDTFMFDALVHGRVDTEGLLFDMVMQDVEELNKKAANAVLDVTKMSFHGYAYVADDYQWLDAGSALGKNNGPLLISKHKIYPDEVNDIKIAIPGEKTTANLLLSVAFPNAQNRHAYLFSDIEEVVLSGECDAGLIIHENRFTYAQRGLHKILDLGEFWEEKTQSPIPLGGIAIKRSLPEELKLKVNRILKRSVAYAFAHPKEAYPFIREHAKEMDESVMYRHIDLYVNEFSKELGEEGRRSITYLYDFAQKHKLIPDLPEQIFLT
jgi:1,4-dihydroxy-6-naphthoate synthase